MSTQSYILIHCNLGKENDVKGELQKLEEIREVHVVMGSYDIVCLVEVNETKELRPLVTNKIRTINGVRQTMTVIIV
ncbi:MAG: Lrp/AsnC ligand binding domain-containing protein [Candidatus Heimdallarchaeota archaeon]|nr:Lrp/AsnC ligand binding domain-containing protein [Candidatus Heimdallarchaeota archaeon]